MFFVHYNFSYFTTILTPELYHSQMNIRAFSAKKTTILLCTQLQKWSMISLVWNFKGLFNSKGEIYLENNC